MDNFDLFGKSITLSLRGKDVHNSRCGGLTSLLIYILMAGYVAIMITQPLQAATSVAVSSNFTNTTAEGGSLSAGEITIGGITFEGVYSYKKLEYHYNAYQDLTQYDVFKNGFNIAVDFQNNYWDPITMYFEFYALVPFGTYNYKYEYIEAMDCNASLYPTQIRDEMCARLIIENAL